MRHSFPPCPLLYLHLHKIRHSFLVVMKIFPIILLITPWVSSEDLLFPLQPGGWMSDGSREIEIQNNVFSVTSGSSTDDDTEYRGLWVEGIGSSTGEHFWMINFTRLGKTWGKSRASVGFSKFDLFQHGREGQGLFYDGNLKSSGKSNNLIDNFGPVISQGDTLGLLASFNAKNTKLRFYLFHNDKPLGLAFFVPTSAMPTVLPTVSFTNCKGSAEIWKELEVPSFEERNPPKKKFEGIAGSWAIVPSTIQINGEIHQDKHFDPKVFVKFSSLGGNWYNGSLKVVNNVSFGIEKTKITWKNFGSWSTLPTGFTTKLGHLERWMRSLMNNPDRVIFVGGLSGLTVVKGSSRATFRRLDDSTRGFNGNPFRNE